MKATKETQDMKEELQRKEQIKEAAKKRQEKLDDLEAKRRIKAKIEADKEERRRKAEEAKAAREGRSAASSAAAAAPEPAAPATKAPVNHTQARLRLQTPGGNLIETFPADATLFEVASLIEKNKGIPVTSLSTTFPKKTWSGPVDFGQTLKECGLVPSGVLVVR
jgi:UBX domain-containing protein 1/4